MNKIWIASLIAINLFACDKGKIVPIAEEVTVPERIEIAPTTISITTGQTAQYTAKYFDKFGKEATLPSTAMWGSNNIAVATVNNQGLASAVSVGQTTIKININGLVATANINVVANNNVVSNVNITPNTTQEVILNGNINMMANGTNLNGNILTGLSFTWASDAPTVVSVSNTGQVTGLAYGTANIKATSSNIQSPPTMVQVIRQGNFVSMNSMGTAKLKIENGTLKLITSANFSFSPAPDLRMYLTNSATTVNASNSVQIAALTSAGITGGARSWNVPANVNITQYRYAMVWCTQFNGNYGVADLGN